MINIVALGELLVDFTPIPTGRQGCLQPHAGGAPCNVLAMAQQMGSTTAFIGKIGNDYFGNFLKETIEQYGIDTRGLIRSEQFNTTLAFVHLLEDGERSFTFYRRHGADLQLTAKDINYDLLSEARIIHFGSLSFTDNPSKTAVLTALRFAKKQGKIISYDPNYRPALWLDDATACRGMALGLPYANIMKISYQEGRLLSGQSGYDQICTYFHQQNIEIICLTLGERGTYISTPRQQRLVKGYKAVPLDTTGAGDCFMGCFLHYIAEANKPLTAFSIVELVHYTEVANAAASLCIEELGGMPAMPTRIATMNRLSQKE